MDEMREITLRLLAVKGFGIKSFLTLWHEVYESNIEKTLESKEVQALLSKESFQVSNESNYVCLWEESYPISLKQIADPPLVLFYLGNKELLNADAHAIVGTRNISSYGKFVTTQIIEELTSLKPLIVSGLAFGVDSLVHRQCLKNEVPTAAVLASSVEDATPRQNKPIYDQILARDGIILSEAYSSQEVVKGMFARRNRIVAGLSRSTTVIEAPEDSGALITANLAFDYGREVYAVPNSWLAENSQGCNQLIAQSKAQLITSASDFVAQIYPNFNRKVINTNSLDARLSKLSQAIIRLLSSEEYESTKLIKTLTEFTEDAILSELVKLEIAGLIEKKLDGTIAIK